MTSTSTERSTSIEDLDRAQSALAKQEAELRERRAELEAAAAADYEAERQPRVWRAHKVRETLYQRNFDDRLTIDDAIVEAGAQVREAALELFGAFVRQRTAVHFGHLLRLRFDSYALALHGAANAPAKTAAIVPPEAVSLAAIMEGILEDAAKAAAAAHDAKLDRWLRAYAEGLIGEPLPANLLDFDEPPTPTRVHLEAEPLHSGSLDEGGPSHNTGLAGGEEPDATPPVRDGRGLVVSMPPGEVPIRSRP